VADADINAVDKTNRLGRVFLPISVLEANPLNPNEMTGQEFNLLHDNIQDVGITDPILVRHHPSKEGMYRIIGGEHRWEVAKLIGFTEVPCTVVSDEDLSEDKERFQMVRHNIIHGKMSPRKFASPYESLSGKYSDEVAAEAFGFVEEEEFTTMVRTTAKNLPTSMVKEFTAAAKDVKTIDGLASLLNRLFSEHGDTLPYGYMIFDFGGKDSVWLRMSPKQKKDFMDVAAVCQRSGKALDHLIGGVLQLIAKGTLVNFKLEDFLGTLPDVVFVEDNEVPTLDFLEEL
jgi:ParB/RepB/Spo0J family partition protein